ncbi:MAG TPA: DUF2892 domain-containing protein [Waddliaceae bacterium]
MKKNIGTKDRFIRLSLALILLMLAWLSHSWIILAVGLFVLYEAAASWCIYYQLTGKNTCSINKK